MNGTPLTCASCRNVQFAHNDTVIRAECGHYIDEACFSLFKKNLEYYCHARTCNKSLKNHVVLQLKSDGRHLEIFNTNPSQVQSIAWDFNHHFTNSPEEFNRNLLSTHPEGARILCIADALFLRDQCSKLKGTSTQIGTYFSVSILTEKRRFLSLCTDDKHTNPTSRTIFQRYQTGKDRWECLANAATVVSCCAGAVFCCLPKS